MRVGVRTVTFIVFMQSRMRVVGMCKSGNAERRVRSTALQVTTGVLQTGHVLAL